MSENVEKAVSYPCVTWYSYLFEDWVDSKEPDKQMIDDVNQKIIETVEKFGIDAYSFPSQNKSESIINYFLKSYHWIVTLNLDTIKYLFDKKPKIEEQIYVIYSKHENNKKRFNVMDFIDIIDYFKSKGPLWIDNLEYDSVLYDQYGNPKNINFIYFFLLLVMNQDIQNAYSNYPIHSNSCFFNYLYLIENEKHVLFKNHLKYLSISRPHFSIAYQIVKNQQLRILNLADIVFKALNKKIK